jgi:hypothetical protein
VVLPKPATLYFLIFQKCNKLEYSAGDKKRGQILHCPLCKELPSKNEIIKTERNLNLTDERKI